MRVESKVEEGEIPIVEYIRSLEERFYRDSRYKWID